MNFIHELISYNNDSNTYNISLSSSKVFASSLSGLVLRPVAAKAAVTEGGNCKACLTASMSVLVREGFGEWRRGGRGGAGDLGPRLNTARGGCGIWSVGVFRYVKCRTRVTHQADSTGRSGAQEGP